VKRGGYTPRYVDAAMDRLEEVFFERERRALLRAQGDDAWWAETRQLLSEVRGRIQRTRGKRFRRRGIFATGYRRSQVDAFLDRIAEMFERRELALKPAEVRDVVFHSEWRGYDEDQVDALLDAVVELILATRQ
jgi:DivIVA domain-containing protein